MFTDEEVLKLNMNLKSHIVIDLAQDDGLRLSERLKAAEKVCQFHLDAAGASFGRMQRKDEPLLKTWLQECGKQ